MFALNDSDRERFIELLEDALPDLTQIELPAFDLELARVALEQENLSLMGESLAALAALKDPRYDALQSRLETALHKPQWLDHILRVPTHPAVISYAIEALLSMEPPKSTLTVAHVIGQLNTLQQHQPNGMEKILGAIELLYASQKFLTELDPDTLFMYGTSAEQVCNTLAEVDQLIGVYQQFLDEELFASTPQQPTQVQDKTVQVQDKTVQDAMAREAQYKKEASRKKQLDKFYARSEKDKLIAEKARLPSLPIDTRFISEASVVGKVALQTDAVVTLEVSELEMLSNLAGSSSARSAALKSLQTLLSAGQVQFRPNVKYSAKDYNLVQMCLNDPVYKRLRKMANANLGRAPSLGLVLQMHNQAESVLCAAVHTDIHKLEPAYCLYLKKIKEPAQFAAWLHSTLVDLIHPYRESNCWEHMVRTLFCTLYYLLQACGGKELEDIWPFQGHQKSIADFL